MLSKPSQIIHEGSSQYRCPHCKTCVHIKTGTTYSSATMHKQLPIARPKVLFTYMYLIECNKCHKQYVGETENVLHLRMNGHQSDYSCKLSGKPVAVHFNSVGHTFSDHSIMVIEQLWRDDAAHWKSRESY